MTSIHHYIIGTLSAVAAAVFFHSGMDFQGGASLASAGMMVFYEVCDRTDICNRLTAYSATLK